MADILSQIIADKRLEVASTSQARPLADVQAAAAKAPPARDFLAAISLPGSPRIIAECKRMSPSRGVMVQDYDPVRLATAYARGGAAAISVLTDAKYFGGELAHLVAVRRAVSIPVLRKDFIIDEYQIYEARAAGADTFLLLSGVLDPKQIEAYLQIGRRLGMEPLIESHTEAELTAALKTTGNVFGVNNRDLKTFHVDLAIARGLVALTAGRNPAAVMVCESGIKAGADVARMGEAGYNVFLVGESVSTSADPAGAVAALVEGR